MYNAVINAARYDDVLEIDCWTEGLGKASIRFGYRTAVVVSYWLREAQHAVLDRDTARLKPGLEYCIKLRCIPAGANWRVELMDRNLALEMVRVTERSGCLCSVDGQGR